MKLMGSEKLLVSDNEREPSISKVSFKRQLPFPNLYSPLPKRFVNDLAVLIVVLRRKTVNH
jgi:hypothetical protein